jgi:glycosyltransferase involved in cell wall biosynthesis
VNHNWPEAVFILIPAYKASHLLRKLLPNVKTIAPSAKILVVDDASFDGTEKVCAEFNVNYTAHPVNKGKGAALATGFSYLASRGAKWIITMDADGQHAPSELHTFLDMIQKNPEAGICIGARSMKPKIMPPERIFSNRLTSFMLGRFCGIRVDDSQCGYRAYNTAFLKKIRIAYNRFEMESEVIMKAAFLGFPVTFMPIQTLYLDGPSHISHLIDTLRWVGAVLNIRFRKKQIIAEAKHQG